MFFSMLNSKPPVCFGYSQKYIKKSQLIWKNNLRGVGIILFFLTAFFSLFWGDLKKQLFD